jgi:Na+-translocating ferredoxin:NAD+ oxidoreductase RNF subunit RnfB
MIEGRQPYHAIKLDTQKCFGCTRCMKICPPEAIRIYNGFPQIDAEKCIDCGDCLRSCPVGAFYVEQNDLSAINLYKYRVALFPSVMIGQFPEKFTEGQIYQALLKIGFTHIFEVEQPIKILIDGIQEYCDSKPEAKPMISSFCPAVLRLIQVKFPSLAENVVMKKPPHDLAAHYAIEKLRQKGIKRDEVGLFYITPCAAKIAAVKGSSGEKESVIDGVLNMSEIFNRIMKVISKDEEADVRTNQLLSREGILWSQTNGEASNIVGNTIAVDGIHSVVSILERVENDKLPGLDFLELRSCDQGCAGGILLTGNRFLTIERLKQRAKNYPGAQAPEEENIKESLFVCIDSDQLETGLINRFGTDRTKALEKMQKAHKIACQLPGIDCGACGTPNCLAMADDIAMGKAKMSDCVFLQQRWESQGKISSERAFGNMEKKWGKGRFEADCNIKGSRNEGY